jgi:hypothetical protein
LGQVFQDAVDAIQGGRQVALGLPPP